VEWREQEGERLGDQGRHGEQFVYSVLKTQVDEEEEEEEDFNCK